MKLITELKNMKKILENKNKFIFNSIIIIFKIKYYLFTNYNIFLLIKLFIQFFFLFRLIFI